MADARAERLAPKLTRNMVGAAALVVLLAGAGCNGALLNLSGTDQNQEGAPAEELVDHMSEAVAIRDAACYSDFQLANASIETKLAESIRGISAGGGAAGYEIRDEMILGLRFNANLQKRLAFDTLEECLR